MLNVGTAVKFAISKARKPILGSGVAARSLYFFKFSWEVSLQRNSEEGGNWHAEKKVSEEN